MHGIAPETLQTLPSESDNSPPSSIGPARRSRTPAAHRVAVEAQKLNINLT